MVTISDSHFLKQVEPSVSQETWICNGRHSDSLTHCELQVNINFSTCIKHWWFSGKIGRCHSRTIPQMNRPAPGSIPGRCMMYAFRRVPFCFCICRCAKAKWIDVVDRDIRAEFRRPGQVFVSKMDN